jgi:hypothetical protein
MVHGPSAKGLHQYFPTYGHFMERCQQAGYSLGKLIDLHPELRDRFIENGKRTRFLKRFHSLYGMFSSAADPIYRAVVRWDERRGTGSVAPVLDQHYYWAVRYNFFLGYNQYVRFAGTTRSVQPPRGRGRVPTLAIERRD